MLRRRLGPQGSIALLGQALAILLAVHSAMGEPARRQGSTFYVAVDGDNSWSGRLPAPNGDRTDGPFATLQAARDAMRKSEAEARKTYIRGGDYYLPHGLDLTAADSGQSYLAYPAETPVLHGGVPIVEWSHRSDGIWEAPAPPNGFPRHTGATTDLFVNGARQVQARYPRYLTSDPVRTGWLFAAASRPGQDVHRTLRFKPGDLPPIPDASDVWVSIFSQNGWENQVKRIAHIDRVNGIIELRGDSWWETMGLGSRYFLFNLPDRLDAAHEWHYDPMTRQIRYAAESGFLGNKVVLGTAGAILSINGGSDITVSGLTLTGTLSEGRAIDLQGARNVALLGNTIENARDGIYLHGVNTLIRIRRNRILAMNFSGINLDTGSYGLEITGNRIHDIGYLLKGGAGIWFHGISDTLIAHNMIDNTSKFGIGGGSMGIGIDPSYRVTIEFNEIKNANIEASDGGAIMIAGRQRDLSGDIIRYNRISGTRAAGTVSWDGTKGDRFLDPVQKLISFAIYLDEFAAGVQVYGNLLQRNIGGMLIHGGWGNTVSNNIVVDGSGPAMVVHDPPGDRRATDNVFERNIIYLTEAGSTAAATEVTMTGAKWDNNLYSGPQLGRRSFLTKVPGLRTANDLAGWQRFGFDVHSRIADPQFVDPGSGNYHLAPGSPAFALRFADLPLDRMGVAEPPMKQIGCPGDIDLGQGSAGPDRRPRPRSCGR